MTDPRAPAIRVLVVDDSVVVRRLVQRALETEPDIDVVGHRRQRRGSASRRCASSTRTW